MTKHTCPSCPTCDGCGRQFKHINRYELDMDGHHLTIDLCGHCIREMQRTGRVIHLPTWPEGFYFSFNPEVELNDVKRQEATP